MKDREYFEWHREWLKSHPNKKFYNIPDVEGTKHLDIGWVEGDFPIIGATLGVDPSSARENWNYESDPDQEKRTRDLHKSIDFEEIAATGENLPFLDGTIDSVSSQHSMGMYYDLEEGLAEAIRVLRPGGKLGVITWKAPISIKETRTWLRRQPVTNIRIRTVLKGEGDDHETVDGEEHISNLYGIEFTRV